MSQIMVKRKGLASRLLVTAQSRVNPLIYVSFSTNSIHTLVIIDTMIVLYDWNTNMEFCAAGGFLIIPNIEVVAVAALLDPDKPTHPV